ncbi:MAG: glucan biosynthesis protein G [Alphaproteobacteria bacterium]
MRRRDVLAAMALSPFFGVLPVSGEEAVIPVSNAKLADPVPFNAGMVRKLAQKLASKKYEPPKLTLPKELENLTYDQYRDIRFRPDQAIWRSEALPFQMHVFHSGFFFIHPVTIHLVDQDESRKLLYSSDYFSFGPSVLPPPPEYDLGFAGFRLHTPINRDDYFDEMAVFQGASYFRAVAKGQAYGLSARGLAIDTAEPSGEEFPLFRAFWIEKPRPGSSSIVVHALLDSERTAGAYRFTMRPGVSTEMDVEVTLYPRTNLARAGFAPLTSMFLFNASDRVGIDDFRPAVHDSSGLSIRNGQGEWLWRPLSNPATLQYSVFMDHSPRGFGLMQRERRFENFEDLEAHYERRPSVWIEPIGDWGPGAVHLVEIPSRSEVNDNIVVYWRPADTIPGGSEYVLNYRMQWCNAPTPEPDVAMIIATRAGTGWDKPTRLFVIDFAGAALDKLPADTLPEPVIEVSEGKILNPVVQPNPETRGWRLSFELETGDAQVIELRCHLDHEKVRLSEVWVNRWTI